MKNENVCTHDIEKFRDRIEKLRGDTPQKEFCEGIGVSVRTYQNWVNPLYKGYNGKTSYTLPNIETAIRICDKYGVSLDYLFGRIDCETVSNQDIYNKIGLNDQGIEGLKGIKQSDDNAIQNEQPGLCVLPVLNKMLGCLWYFESILRAFRDYMNTDYCIPVYHTGKGIIRRSEKHGNILDNETISSSSDMDIIKGHTIKYTEKGKEKTATFPDMYLQHFARENDLYDNIPVTITKEFLQAVALQQLEGALVQIKEHLTENTKA